MFSRTAILNSEIYTWDYLQNDDTCRLCLSRDAHRVIALKPSENEEVAKNLLAEKIVDCLGLDLNVAGAPRKVCSKCCDIVENFYDFKRFCSGADRKLKEILNNRDVESPDGVPEHSFHVKLEKDYDCDIEDSLQGFLNQTPLKEEQTNKNRKSCSATFCFICRSDFKTIDKFTKHNSESHGIEPNGEFKCFGCDKRFKNRKNRLGHEINFCKGLKDGYKCRTCDRYLPKRRMYEIHMRAHRLNKSVNYPENIFKCGKCYKIFKTKEDLTKHKKSHESKEVFVCETCGQTFSRRDYLHKHMLTHRGTRQHACAHCEYKAAQRSSLLVHMRKHTGERPFGCDLCPQRCVSSSNLRAHRRRHLGVKQFQCTICPKKFGYKLTLEEHIAATHERVQSHLCPQCGAIYSRSRGLRRHLQAKHGNTKEKLPSKTEGASGKEFVVIAEHQQVKSGQELVLKDQVVFVL